MPKSNKPKAAAKEPRAGKKNSAQPEAAAPPTTTPLSQQPTMVNPRGLPVVYDKLSHVERSINSPHGPLDPAEVRAMLGWETEPQYQARMVREKGGKPEHWLFGDEFHCIDTDSNKVRCWNNAGNRPFDLLWCKELIHTILHGQWAGPLTVPGETVNGETIRISRYGRVLSGQHQGTALVLADEFLQKSKQADDAVLDPKYPFWVGRDHCVIETIVITGLSEDERVLRTIDYVKPRSVADMLYTMQLFVKNNSVERKEMTRMLSTAIDTLWERTDTKGYRTHPEVVGFLERHPRLLECVDRLFVENSDRNQDSDRRISRLHLNPGVCAALCYLMGCGTQKTLEYSDEYRNESPPSERNLDWGYWDKAREFWKRLAGDHGWVPVQDALTRLLDSSPENPQNPGMGGKADEKLAIIAKAWERWRGCAMSGQVPPFSADDLARGGILTLTYNRLDDKGNALPPDRVKLLDTADFGGIDCPESLGGGPAQHTAPPMPNPPTADDIYGTGGLADQARARREQK